MRQLTNKEMSGIILKAITVMAAHSDEGPFRMALVYFTSYHGLLRSVPADKKADLIACVAQIQERWDSVVKPVKS